MKVNNLTKFYNLKETTKVKNSKKKEGTSEQNSFYISIKP